MDMDSLAGAHGSSWERFRKLLRKRRLRGSEADEFLDLYRLVSADLVRARTLAGGEFWANELTDLTMRARARFSGPRRSFLARLSLVVRYELPSALYAARWWIVSAYVLFFAAGALQWTYLSSHPEVVARMGSAERLQQVASGDFVEYYYESPNATFAASVWSNNALIAAMTVATALTGFLPVAILIQNAVGVATTSWVVVQYESWWHLLRYLMPHGQLELSAIFVAMGAAWFLFWRLLVPGRQPRAQVLAREGRRFVLVVGFLVFLLAVSGFQEGFVTPSYLPDWLRVGQGSVTLVLLWVYILVVGRRAARVEDTLSEGGSYDAVA